MALQEGVWTTPSISNGNGGSNCVETKKEAGGVFVRDSMDREGPVLEFGGRAWQNFADHAGELAAMQAVDVQNAAVRAGELN